MASDEVLRDLKWLSDRWGISPGAIHQLRYRGEGPPAVRIGKRLRFRESDVVAYERAHLETLRLRPPQMAG